MAWEYWIVDNDFEIETPLVMCNNERLRDKIFFLMRDILDIDCARIKKELIYK
jgi:hypothetical protein